MRFRRRNTAWLVALGLVIGLALLAAGSTVAAPVQLALLAIFALAMGASFIELGQQNQTLLDTIRTSPVRGRITPQAKEAEARAKARGLYYRGGITMLDVGLIAVQTSEEGMAMRRTISVSKDDDGVRPYITLFVLPKDAERNASIRFELYDHTGQPRFVYETRKYLREGEVTIMSDNYLPLAGNDDIKGAGDWESRIYVDGNLMGVQTMILSPSLSERSSRLARQASRLTNDEDVIFDIMDEVKEERAPTLQDLLQKPEETQDAAAAQRRRSATARRRR